MAKSTVTKRKTINSDDKRRGISFGTITMEDVYRKRLSRIREEKAQSSVEKSSLLPLYEETKKAEAVTSSHAPSTIMNAPESTAKKSDVTENQDYEYEDDFEVRDGFLPFVFFPHSIFYLFRDYSCLWFPYLNLFACK